MKIEIGNFELEQDGICVTLYRKIITQAKGRSQGGNEALKIVGHYPSLVDAFDRMVDVAAADSEIIKTADDLMAFLVDTRKAILVAL